MKAKDIFWEKVRFLREQSEFWKKFREEQKENIEERKYVYLAHPRLSKDWVKAWEINMGYKGVDFFNPLNQIEHEDEKKYNMLVLEDLENVIKSQGVVAIVDGRTSYGTIMEMFFTKSLDKPLYTLVTNGYENHPWIKYTSTKVYTNILGLERKLIKEYSNKDMAESYLKHIKDSEGDY